jgi:GPH family glycoside/pentoside/hexuronide:cation symporter
MIKSLGWRRTIAFASGDFAFNLYWQSLSLYLLFYYTEALGLSAAAAGLIYFVASLWDGFADPVIGAAADRVRTRWGRYRPFLLFGTAPLAISFALLYFRPPLTGNALVAAVMAAHLLFRSLYALVNVPYAALTARITRSAADRGNIAGIRMVFATCAYVLVARTTQPIALTLTGRRDDPHGFFIAAILFALLATPILFGVFATTHEESDPSPRRAAPAAAVWPAIRRNRAFWTLVAGGAALIIGYTAFAKSVLYYFKYVLNDEAAGPAALALAGLSGLVVVPLWMLVAPRIGKRAVWLVSCAVLAGALIAFALLGIHAPWQMEALLIAMQTGYLGINLAYWGMLPDTVEYGEWRGGARPAGLIFGLALLLQKVSLGIGAGAFGLALDRSGFVANHAQTPATLAGLKAIMIVLPLTGVAVSALIMAFNPLARGAHERILLELSKRAAALNAVLSPVCCCSPPPLRAPAKHLTSRTSRRWSGASPRRRKRRGRGSGGTGWTATSPSTASIATLPGCTGSASADFNCSTCPRPGCRRWSRSG